MDMEIDLKYNSIIEESQNKTEIPCHDNVTNVEVFCRIKPCNEKQEDEKCVKIIDSQSIKVITPTSKVSNGVKQEITCSFKTILPSQTSQTDVYFSVANQMVDNLLHGRNGLLFAYGITGSGKTHTVSGSSEDPGILPRSITAIYNSVKENLAPPGYIGMDKNGNVELALDSKLDPSTPKKNPRNITVCETPTILRGTGHQITVDNTLLYAMFISMVDIYNNNIYDLFDEKVEKGGNIKAPAMKTMRENAGHIFIPNLKYIPIRSVSEALTYYRKGKKCRRVAETLLNSHSSRSHCVFTIYLVQLEKCTDKGFRSGGVSQLSLCDLAGSERTYRTQNEGDRQKEANSINSSLMTLRTCIDTLRQNQRLAARNKDLKLVPYRESKLTLMFRNFFEGNGNVRMILCVNPIPGDFEENIHVVKFAEITQDVKIKVESSHKQNYYINETTHPSKATNEIHPQVEESITSTYDSCDFPPHPSVILSASSDSVTIENLIKYYIECERKRMNLCREASKFTEELRDEFTQNEREKTSLNENNEKITRKLDASIREINQLRHSVKHSKSKISALEEAKEKLMNENISVKNEFDATKQILFKERSMRQALKRKITELQSNQANIIEREATKRVEVATQDIQNQLLHRNHQLLAVKGLAGNSSIMNSNEDSENIPRIAGHSSARKRKSSSNQANHRNENI